MDLNRWYENFTHGLIDEQLRLDVEGPMLNAIHFGVPKHDSPTSFPVRLMGIEASMKGLKVGQVNRQQPRVLHRA